MSNRINLIRIVKNPLNFFVLVVLVTEALLGGLAFKFKESHKILIPAIIGILVLLIGVVTFIAIFKKGALGEDNKELSIDNAASLGDRINESLDGFLDSAQRKELLSIMAGIIETVDSDNKLYSNFCKQIS